MLKDFQNQLSFPENEIFNEDSFQEKHDEQDQIPKQSYQSIDDFEESSYQTDALHLLNLELNKSPPELQEYDNSATISGFPSLYL